MHSKTGLDEKLSDLVGSASYQLNDKVNLKYDFAVDQNYREVVRLVKEGKVPLEQALKLITTNPAKNLGLKNKGGIEVGMDADFCCLNNDLNLEAVFAKGKQLMENGKVINKDNFD